MSKINVLFLAADPLSAGPDGRSPRLMLDADVREIREKVRMAKYRDALEFDWRFAVRADDLMQGLHETEPQVVHFSGHGGSDGLVLEGDDGRPHPIDATQLERLFRAFRGDIQVVLLSACSSRPQAEAIASVVGCAIGTNRRIEDEAAIRFNASFYRAIAFGDSVQAAFDRACLALSLDRLDAECMHLCVAPGVDPTQLVLVPANVHDVTDAPEPGTAPVVTAAPLPLATTGEAFYPKKRTHRTRSALAAVLISSGLVAAGAQLLKGDDGGPLQAPTEFGIHLGDCGWSGTAPSRAAALPTPAAASSTANDPSGAATALGAGKDLCRVGNYAAAFTHFKQAAEAGDPEAMGLVGIAYLAGEGVERQPELATTWLRRSTEERDARGMYAFGVAYHRGDGLNQSDRWAKHWYEAAAEEKGYPPAMRSLGRLHLDARRDSLAMAWYQKAAGAGSLDAMVNIGLMYEAGRAVTADPQAALRWYGRAAAAGSARAMFESGALYQKGVGGPPDFDQARAWYLRAADVGSAEAMNNLGLLYRNGWGVPQDRREAMRWFRRAADAGSPLAQGFLAALDAD